MLLRMINSVGEYVAGAEYEVPDKEADRFVLLGYATTEGDLSQPYTDQEIAELTATGQTVSV